MFKVGERVLVETSEINPLAECYVTQSNNKMTTCNFSYLIFSGMIEIPTSKISKYPIVERSFVYQLDFIGNRMPVTNKFQEYFKEYRGLRLKLTSDIFIKECIRCFKKTYESKMKLGKVLLPELVKALNQSYAIDIIDSAITETVARYPNEFRNTYLLEYCAMDKTCFINSDKFLEEPAALYLISFALILIETGLTTREELSNIIKDELKNV